MPTPLCPSRVFFLEKPRRELDLSSAAEYGKVMYLFESNDRRSSVFHVQNYSSDVLLKLKLFAFNPEVDVFAIAGSMLSISLALLALSSYCEDKITLLLFNSKTDQYEKRTVSLHGLANLAMEPVHHEHTR